MAKNVFQKKKRISHFQVVTKDELSGCHDYVTSIIDNMDSSFKSMNSDFSKIRAKRKSISNDDLNASSSSKPLSSDKGFSQNQKILRKFTMSRKFPLMEKSQKILKQIKHNRNFSKPRAHLAGLPKSPLKADVGKVSSVRKKKENPKDASQVKNKAEKCSTTLSGNSLLKSSDVPNKNSKNNYKISKEIQNFAHKEGETSTSNKLDSYSRNEHLYDAGNKLNMNVSIEKSSLHDTKASKYSESETSDSEYERFVKENKKGLRKKVVKKQKRSAAKQSTSLKGAKRNLSKNRLEQYTSDRSDSNDNDTPLPKNSKRVNSFKKCKIAQVYADIPMKNSDEESDSDMIVDVINHDSSSESDKADRNQPFEAKNAYPALQKVVSLQDLDTGSDSTLPDISAGNNETTSETSHVNVDNVVPQSYRPDISFTVHDSDTGSDATLPDVSASNNKTAPETCHVTVDNVVPKSYATDVSSHVSSSSDLGKTELNDSTANLVIDLCSDNESEIGVCTEYSSLSAQTIENNAEKGDLKGFTKTDDNCNDVISKKITLEPSNHENILLKDAQNACTLDSEESDIEIIDIVSIKPKDECIVNVASNVLGCSNYEVKSKEGGQAVEYNVISNISNRNSKVVVKTEKLYGTANVENHNSINKYEAAYITNICTDSNQDDVVNINQRTLISSEGRELLGTSLKNALPHGSVLQKDLKQENESDDDIILLDLVESANVPDFSSHKRVKTEVPDILAESLKCVKYSAHKILKMEMDNHSQNHCDSPQVIKEINKNIKNEHGESLSTLKNTCSKECVVPPIKDTSSVKDELKLHDVHSSSSILSSKFSGIKYETNQASIDVNKVKESHLIELFRKEFDTYQEIVQTGESVTASLKVLEVRQAEKVEYIRSLVKKCIPNGKDSSVKSVNKDFLKDLPPSPSIAKSDVLTSSKIDSDIKPNISNCDLLETVQQPTVMLKQEPESSQKYRNLSEVEPNKNQTLKLLNEKCNACGKEAMAACQRCAKVFFCSNECGRKFWDDGHINECGT